MVLRFIPNILFTVFVFIIFIFGAYEAVGFSKAGRLFPLAIAGGGIILTLIQLLVDFKNQLKGSEGGQESNQDYVDIAPDVDIPIDVVRERGLRFLGWIIGLYLFIWVFGFKISVPVFIIAYLRIEAKASWIKIILLSAITVYLVFYHFEKILGVFWPKPLIANLIHIPWLL